MDALTAASSRQTRSSGRRATAESPAGGVPLDVFAFQASGLTEVPGRRFVVPELMMMCRREEARQRLDPTEPVREVKTDEPPTNGEDPRNLPEAGLLGAAGLTNVLERADRDDRVKRSIRKRQDGWRVRAVQRQSIRVAEMRLQTKSLEGKPLGCR